MPHLHRRRGATFEAPPPPPVVEAEGDLEPLEPVVVDEHGDDAAAVADVVDPPALDEPAGAAGDEPVVVVLGEPGPELDVPAARRRRRS